MVKILPVSSVKTQNLKCLKIPILKPEIPKINSIICLIGTTGMLSGEISTFLKDFNKTLPNATKQDLKYLEEQFCAYKLKVQNTYDYDKSEVCAGGIDTKEISSKTFESLKVKNLYFIGECLDITGELGGYNLHFAWASAKAASTAILKNI